jgi:hypothetical protein
VPTPSTPNYVREDLFDTLYSNVVDLVDSEQYADEVATKARRIQQKVDDVQSKFDEFEEFSNTATEYMLWLEDLNSELEEKLEESGDIQHSYLEDLLDDHINRMDGLLDEYLSNMDRPTQTGFDGLYKSPIINVGTDSRETSQEPELNWDRYKSPEINVGSVPTAQSTNSAIDASRIPDSWDGYGLEDDMCDPEFSGEPVFDSPKSFVESQDINLDGEQSYDDVSIDVSYNGTNEDDLAFLNAAS